MAEQDSADGTEERGSIRSCAGCRERAPREALLRFAIAELGEESALVPDLRRKLPGRGVSVHPTRACLELAFRKGGFARALKGKPRQSAKELAVLAVLQFEKRIDALVLAAWRAKKLCVGTDSVRAAMGRESVELLIVASDAEGRRQELVGSMERLGRRALKRGDKASLGRLLGRDEVAVLGVLDPGIAREVVAAAAHAAELAEAE